MANVLSLVSYKILPASLGGQKGIHLFNKFLSEHHDILCITIKDNDASCAEGYKIEAILTNSKWRYLNIFYFFEFRKLIKENNIRFVILEHPYYGWLGLLLKWFCNIRLIVHSHNIEAHRFRSLGNWWWPLIWLYEKWTHRLANATFNISPEDKQYMIDHFGIKKEKCTVITYGIERRVAPSVLVKMEAKKILCTKHGIDEDAVLYFYNGTLDYLPNLNGVKAIINDIAPIFESPKPYKIIICGKDLPAEYNELKDYVSLGIIYAGFVDDINLYFTGTDIFINPVTDGAGIKTKLVEALAHDLYAISCFNGAYGVDPLICNGKLSVVDNNDWQAFAEKMEKAQDFRTHIGEEFFAHFNWKQVTARASKVIENLD